MWLKQEKLCKREAPSSNPRHTHPHRISQLTKKIHGCWVTVAHTCNPSSSGGREQEDRGSRPAQGNSSQDPISKKKKKKKSQKGRVQGVGPEFKPQYG
jgi:hypothetical protein